MSFVDVRLSKCVALGFSGGPMWNTLVTSMTNGMESRNAQWSMPHYKYTADYNVLKPAERNEIATAFLAVRGQKDSFRFKDWFDYSAADASLGVGDNTSTPRQLVKDYTFGSATYSRRILLPIASTLVVKANGSPIAVTVDDETGMVTPSAPWPNGQVITSSFEFDVRVRFASDYYPFSMPIKTLAQVSVDLVEALTP